MNVTTRLIHTLCRRSDQFTHYTSNSTLTRLTIPSHFSLSFTRCVAIETIRVPSMGDSISNGTLIEFTKNVGDGVAVDEIVARIETDKVTVDVRSPSAGVIKSLKAKQDETVAVGAELVEIDSDAKVEAQTSKPTPVPQQSQQQHLSQPRPSSVLPPSRPSPVSPLSTAPVQSLSERAHQPLIHFRYGVRDANGSINGHIIHIPSSKPIQLTADKQITKSAVNAPRHPADFFATSAQEWQEANRRAAEALRSLPDYYTAFRRVKSVEMDQVNFGGAVNYLTKKERAELEKQLKEKPSKKAKA